MSKEKMRIEDVYYRVYYDMEGMTVTGLKCARILKR
jgi:hypothetical protein